MKLVTQKRGRRIPMHKLKYGQIAVIQEEKFPEYCGRIVIKTSGGFDTLGEGPGLGYSTGCSNRVRVLRKGELLKV
jgi:hypothetical protein